VEGIRHPRQAGLFCSEIPELAFLATIFRGYFYGEPDCVAFASQTTAWNLTL